MPVTTNVNSAAEELAYFMTHSRAVGVITQPSLAEVVRAAASGDAWRVVTSPVHNGAATDGFEPFADLDGDPQALPYRSPDP